MSDIKILFEDRHLIAALKPYGVLSQGDGSKHSFCDDIAGYLHSKGEKDDVFVLHRLDKTTGGVMIFAKTKDAAAKFSEIIQNGGLNKTYCAVVEGILEEKQGELEDLLYHDKSKNKTYVVKRERKGVKKAKLIYKTIGESVCESKSVSKVEVRLITGRTHQIRVQFASRKHPLVGDKKYGSTKSFCTIALWSQEIDFTHPYTGERVCVKAKPESEIFNIFD